MLFTDSLINSAPDDWKLVFKIDANGKLGSVLCSFPNKHVNKKKSTLVLCYNLHVILLQQNSKNV